MSSEGETTAKIRAAEGGVPESQWRRLHPISPLIDAWHLIAVLFAIGIYQGVDVIKWLASGGIGRFDPGMLVFLVVAGVGGVVLIAAAYSWFQWRVTRFAVSSGGVYYRRGILVRTLKHARLDRIQAVDLSYPLLGRLFGLGRLNIEVAGGQGSSVSFGFLKTDDLEALRAEILARAAGVLSDSHESCAPPAPGDVSDEGQPVEGSPSSDTISAQMRAARGGLSGASSLAPIAPERALYTVPSGRLLGALLVSIGNIIGVVVILAVVIATIIAFRFFGASALASLVGIIAIPIAIVATIWSGFASEFNFTAAVSPDGIRTRSGLLETRSQTIPPKRVHAVCVLQPILWRHFGWYRVVITQAGYAGTDDSSGQRNTVASVLLPVGTREEAELALWLVIRDLGVDNPAVFIEAAFTGTGSAQGFIPVPERAKIIDPCVRRRRAVALTDTSLVLRDGWLTRSLSLIPFERLQSICVTQGPWERALNLADVDMEIVKGQALTRAYHMDVDAAAQLVEELRSRARIRRGSEAPDKWMTRVEAVLDARQEGEESVSDLIEETWS